MRIVLDTNVVVSAILFGGKPQEILEAALAGDFRLCISEPMVVELQGVLQRPKFEFNRQIVQSIVSEITLLAEWVTPTKHFELVEDDPADNDVIDCAVEANADFLISGDRHLLQLGMCVNIQIVSSDSFIKILEKRPR